MKNYYNKIKWIRKSVNIDLDTGELITMKDRDKYYIIIKKNKNVYKITETQRIIEYTNECRRKPKQGTLQF